MDRREFLLATSVASAVPLIGRARDVTYDPTERSIAELGLAMQRGAISAEVLAQTYLARIARFDAAGPKFRSVLAVNPKALEQARALDREREAGKTRGPLHGIPILIKDNIETLDPLPTTAGSRALRHSTHAVDAPLVARLRSAGAVILGKTNLSEWANFRSSRSTSGWSGVGGQTGNAYAVERNPSGSSSGSAVAAALSFCAAAVGTETDGSILSPSAYNGLVGLKPTVGAVSGRGIVPLSPRQDTAGPMARSAADAAVLMNAMSEQPLRWRESTAGLESFRLRGLRVGVVEPSRAAHPATIRCFEDARRTLDREGAVLVPVSEPAGLRNLDEAEITALLYEFKDSLNRYMSGLDPIKVPSRSLRDLIAFNLAHEADEMPDFRQELFEQAEACGALSDEKYLQALASLKKGADVDGLRVMLATQSIDVLFAAGNAPPEIRDPLRGDRGGEGTWPAIASAAAIAGYPSVTVPAGVERGLPIGIVMVADRFADGLLLQAARAFERAASARVPPRLPNTR